MNSSLIVIVSCGALLLACGFLVATLLMAFFGHPKAYGWLRCSILAAGSVFGALASFFLHAFLPSAGRLRSQNEFFLMVQLMAVACIPMLVGLLAAMGIEKPVVRRAGTFLAFWIFPMVFVTLIVDGRWGGALMPWISLVMVVTMIAWGSLVSAGRRAMASTVVVPGR